MTFYDNLTERQWLQSVWQILRRIEDNLALPPAPLELPAITVEPPDLTAIVTAVTSLNGTAPTADDIARAIADVLAPGRDDSGEALQAVAKGLEMLDHRLQGMGKQAYGGGSVSIPADAAFGINNFPSTAITVDPNNSTTTPLAADATFTGTAATLVAGIDGQSLLKTTDFSLAITINMTLSSV